MNVDSIRQFCLLLPAGNRKPAMGRRFVFQGIGKNLCHREPGLNSSGSLFQVHAGKVCRTVEQEGITPAPYVGRYKWVLLERLDVLRDGELRDLIRESYAMVAAKTRPKTKSKKRSGRGANKRTKK